LSAYEQWLESPALSLPDLLENAMAGLRSYLDP